MLPFTIRDMESERKLATLELKADGPEGSFRATFSTLNVVDLDGDVTLPGAFQDGKEVLISQYGHQWGSLPAGKGVIHADDNAAWVDGQFFLDTTHGKDTYTTVKNLATVQEFSYGFQVMKASYGEQDGKQVRFLEAVDVFEVSPVMRGAGMNTGLQSIKGAMTLEDESEAALTASTAVVRRLKSLADLRAKEGRTLSAANRARLSRQLEALAAMQEEISKLLEETEPESDPKSADDMAGEFARFMRLESRLLGVR